MVKCPFRLASTFDPADGTWYWVTDASYTGPNRGSAEAAGDGVAIDTTAIEAVMSAAALDGKGVYFPEGVYRCVSVQPPDGLTIRGAGVGSVLQDTSDGSWGGNVLYLLDRSDISISYLTVRGIDEGALLGGGTCIRMGNSHRITIDHCWFTKQYFALRTGYNDSDQGCTDITITNCATDSNAHSGLVANCCDGLTVANCTFDSYTGDAGGTSHQLYAEAHLTNATFTDCELVDGSNYALQIYGALDCSSITFTRLKFTNVKGGLIMEPDGGTYSGITFIDLYGRSNRFEDESWLRFIGACQDILVDGFDLDGADSYGIARGSGLSAGEVVFQNGTITNCGATYAGYTPPGFKNEGGSAIVSTGNTVTS